MERAFPLSPDHTARRHALALARVIGRSAFKALGDAGHCKFGRLPNLHSGSRPAPQAGCAGQRPRGSRPARFRAGQRVAIRRGCFVPPVCPRHREVVPTLGFEPRTY